jgi:RHS repeat-associated protein
MDGTAMKRLLCAVLAMAAASAALAATPPKRAAVDTAEAWASGLAYTYDPSGNIRTIGTHNYYYDTAGRLVYGTADSASNAQQFEYDAFGNRTNAARTENAQNCFGGLDCEQSPAVDPQTNRLIADGVIAYDAAGNLTQANTNYQYSFDAVGAMTSSTKPAAQYIYTADDERIAVYSGEWRWTVRDLGAHVLREYTSQGMGGQSQWTWSRDHVYRGALPLASVTAAGTLHLHLDHLGTPRLITDAGGTLVAEHAYYAFGTELSLPLSESPREKLHFTGHERDETTDVLQLDYMHARYYTAALGRFLSVDPILGTPVRPQSWNRYAYVSNNPLNLTDPSGKVETAFRCDENGDDCYYETTQKAEDYTAWDTAADAIDGSFETVFEMSGVGNVMAGIYNDNPVQMAAGVGQELMWAGPSAVTSALKPAAGATSSLIVNLGGEGEVAGANVVNVQPTMDAALHASTKTSQQIVVASGDALPFRTGSVSSVVTNNVPVGQGSTWLGARYAPSEIARVLGPGGTWTGSSALRLVLTRVGTWPW